MTPLLRSSTFRLVLVYMGLFSVSALLLLAFIYWSTAAYMSAQTDATIEAQITGLAERYRLTNLNGVTRSIRERLARNPTGSSLYLLAGPDFRPLVGNLDGWPSEPPSEEGWLEFDLGDPGPNGDTYRARARTFRLRGGFHLLVGRDMHELEEFRALTARTLTWGVAITLLLALLGGIMMSRSIVRRIEAINDTSRDIMGGDLTRRIETQGTGDDFDQLAENLNGMLDQIETLMDGVRAVSDNIAHDLKTPLTRLRNRLEELKAGSPDPRGVDAALAEADALLASFNAILRIARIEAGERSEQFTAVDLEALLGDVMELYEPLAEEKRQHIASRLEPATIWGDRDLLFQLFANLLDNAVKYTPQDGRIELATERRDSSVRVRVTDSGPGIAPEDRERVLERFARLESSRNMPGNGLGLSLVAALAKLHQAALRLGGDANGLEVTLDFAAHRPNASARGHSHTPLGRGR